MRETNIASQMLQRGPAKELTSLLENWVNKRVAEGFAELPVESAHAIRAGLLPRHHRDPFDRMLVARAQATGWPIICADPVFELYGVRRIW